MFLRSRTRHKNGKTHRYWSIVENRRVRGNRVVQRQVVYLGEINGTEHAAWSRSIEVFAAGHAQPRQMALFAHGRVAPELDSEVVQVRLCDLELHRPRQWGGCWLAGELWAQLELDAFWAPRLPLSRKGTRWLNVFKTLVFHRLVDPGSEWRLHRQWFEHSALGNLLGEDFSLVQIDKLYRCLDKLLVHKQAFFSALKARWQDLFGTKFDVLLYDLTSTYFECDPPETGKRSFGYSRDKRSDCVQVVIALIVTPEGFPLAYEVMPGNTADSTTLTDFVEMIEAQYGKVNRTWVMDRGIPSEASLAMMRNAGLHYLVGTPKGRLNRMEEAFVELPWEQVRDQVQVKLLDHDGELYVLAKSHGRMSKERGMRRRRLKKLCKRLAQLRRQKLSRDQLLLKIGAAKKDAGRVFALIDIQLPRSDQPARTESFSYSLNRDRLRKTRPLFKPGAGLRGALSVAHQSVRQRPGPTVALLHPAHRDRTGVQGTQGRSGDPPGLPPARSSHRSPHLRGLLSPGDTQTAPARPGAGPDAKGGAGKTLHHADGRCSSADNRPPHHRTDAIHTAGQGSAAFAAALETEPAAATTAENHKRKPNKRLNQPASCSADFLNPIQQNQWVRLSKSAQLLKTG